MTESKKQQYNFNKLHKRLRRNTGRAIQDFNMIEDGDRIMVCMSGGQDSFVLLDILRNLQARAPVNFELIAVNLDQKQPGFPPHILPEYLRSVGVAFHIIEQDTFSIVQQIVGERKSACGLCSRLRRGILYSFAAAHGMSKIALGHHRDDILETLFLNLFNGGTLKAMPPKLLSDNGQHVVIRPLAYCKERDIKTYAANRSFPVIPGNLCGAHQNPQRQAVKAMLQQWEKQQPGRLDSIFAALGNVAPSHLTDLKLFPFAALGTQAQSPAAPNWLLPQARVPNCTASGMLDCDANQQ